MIEVSHLSKMYGPRPAVTDLSFKAEKGEIVGFLGPNGAGKTTTMRILTGYMPATAGEVKVAGFDVFQNPVEVKKRVGYLPETPPLYFEMLVESYVAHAAKLNGMSGQKLKSAVDQAISKTGLEDVRKRIIGNLSKGFRQRVGLAQALVHDPEVLILDEPTVGLDPKQIIEIRNLIKSFKGNHTVILSSHILPEVTATCDRIVVISEGKIVAQDTLEQLTRRLKKGLAYSMTLKSSSTAASSAIQGISGVSSVTADPGDANKLLIDIDSGSGEVRDQIVAAAVQSGAGVLDFSAESFSLEDIFLKLTRTESGGNS